MKKYDMSCKQLEDFSYSELVDLSYFLVNDLGWRLEFANEERLYFYDAISNLCNSKLDKESERLDVILKRMHTNNLFMGLYS